MPLTAIAKIIKTRIIIFECVTLEVHAASSSDYRLSEVLCIWWESAELIQSLKNVSPKNLQLQHSLSALCINECLYYHFSINFCTAAGSRHSISVSLRYGFYQCLCNTLTILFLYFSVLLLVWTKV